MLFRSDLIRRLSIKLTEIREHELETAMARSKKDCKAEVLDDLSRALLNKFTAELYKNMREASRDGRTDICEAAAELFGLRDEQ